MQELQNFLVAFVFSFLGSTPPGTLNLTSLQLGLDHKMNIAWRFALAAAIMEYPYAWLAVTFENLISSSPIVLDNFNLISAVVMIALGVLNIWSVQKPSALTQKIQDSGFRRGLVLGILNPLALPFWIAITAYLSMQNWIVISSPMHLHSYLTGVFLGAFALLIGVAYAAKKTAPLLGTQSKVKIIPGIVLLVLGLYALVEYLF